MGILNKYNSSQLSANMVSDASKRAESYQKTIVNAGSVITKQVTSPTAGTQLDPVGTPSKYEDQVFKGALK